MPTPLRVLIIDDNVDAALALSELVRSLGCEAVCAFGSAMGLRLSHELRPGLVLLDLEMPDADGCQVLVDIKTLYAGATKALYVCLTGTTTQGAEARCMAAGFDHFVMKPIALDRLTALINEARSMAS